MSVVALRARADAPTYADAVRTGVPVALDNPVLHRVVRVDLPAEKVAVVALERLRVLANHFEMNNWLSHGAQATPPRTGSELPAGRRTTAPTATG